MFSYHIFYFPFRWDRKDCREKSFSDRFDITQITYAKNSQWENIPFPVSRQYQTELYNEKNFFYDFVHDVLYDNGQETPIVRHFERKEAYCNVLKYEIKIINDHESIYDLTLKSLVLNLYSTGTGILIFYLENHKYSKFEDILRINQYGRRVFPPFLDANATVEGTKHAELADSIRITGLFGPGERYEEDFSSYNVNDDWKPGRFIVNLIEDLSTELEIKPVIDDRMFTLSWYFSNETSDLIKSDNTYKSYLKSDDWYKYMFIDGGKEPTCRNTKFLKEQNIKHTYSRWQQNGVLYGITRYSFVAISDDSWFPTNILLTHMRTIYAHMTELALVQRASILKFSNEVTELSRLPEKDLQKLANRISNFYKEYIRFVNQIYFREITAQDQGIELYNMMLDSMKLKEQVKDLDDEIGELHNYATILDDKAQNRSLGILTIMGSLFLAPSFIAGYYGMNLFSNDSLKTGLDWKSFVILINIVLISASFYGFVWCHRKNYKKLKIVAIIIIALTTVLSLVVPFLP